VPRSISCVCHQDLLNGEQTGKKKAQLESLSLPVVEVSRGWPNTPFPHS